MSKYRFKKEDGEKILVHSEEKIKVLIDEPAIKKKVKELGKRLTIDYDKVKLPIKVRSWEEGDRFYPLGVGGSKKLQDLFTDNKITVNKRVNIPVFYDREKIIWVGNQRIDHRVRITGKTKKILRMELFEK